MDDILIPCPKCGKELRLRDRALLGRKGRCPKCQHAFVLNEPEEVVLELAENAPVVGTSARYVPDAPSAASARPTAPASGSPAGFAINTAPSAPALGLNVEATAAGGAARLRDQRAKNAKRRKKTLIVSGGVGAVAAIIVIAVFMNMPKQPVQTADDKQPKIDVNYQADKDQQIANVEVAQAAAPIKGEPLDLRGMPQGMNMLLAVRPAELWKKGSIGEEVRYGLGPLGTWGETKLKDFCLYDPAQIEEVVFGAFLTRGEKPKMTAVVRLVEKQPRSEFLKRFKGEPTDAHGRPVFKTGDEAFIIVDEKSFVRCPASEIDAAIEAIASAKPMAGALDEVLSKTDRKRHWTVVFEPRDARISKEFLVPAEAVPFFDHFLDRLNDEDIETVVWSIHAGDAQYGKFFSELVLRNRSGQPPNLLRMSLQKRLKNLPEEMLACVQKMEPQKRGHRQLIGRFPAMLLAYSAESMFGIGDRFVQITTVLPERAGPNLAAAGFLAWFQSTKTDFNQAAPAPTTASPKLPDLLADRLKKPIEIDFKRTPLFQAFDYIGEESSVKVEIDGDALKLSGYTKNMEQNMTLGKVPGEKAIAAILKPYQEKGKEMAVVLDEQKKLLLVTTLPVATQKGLKVWEPSK